MRGSGLPSASRPSASTTAVTPEPQLVIVGLSGSTPASAKACAILLGRGQASVLQDLGERHVERARHVAGAQARARLRLAAGKAPGRARVDHLRAAVVERDLHVGDHGHRAGVHRRLEWCAAARLTAPASSGRPSAFQAGMPPSRMNDIAWRRRYGRSTTPAAPNRARCRHRPRWCRSRRCRARRPPRRTDPAPAACAADRSSVGDGVDVEEHRARNMRGEIFRLGVALLRRQIIGGVDDDDVRLAELAGEPFGGFEPAAGGAALGSLMGVSLSLRGRASLYQRQPHAAVLLALLFDLASPAPRRFRSTRAHGCRRRAAGRGRRSRSAAPGRCPSAASPTWS